MFGKKRNLGQFILQIFSKTKLSNDDIESLEDVLLESDLSIKTVREIVEEIEKRSLKERLNEEKIFEIIKSILSIDLKIAEIFPNKEKLGCILVLGVNGVGKTTSIAKLGNLALKNGRQVIFAAGDTFRAGATKQIELHGQNLGIRVIQQGQGADSGSVIFDALESAKAQGENLVIADTAGRLQNKSQLMKELEKIHKIIESKIDKAQYKKLLVVDSTTGKNALEQAKVFHEAVKLDGIIMSKYDSSAKGGLVHTICKELSIGIAFFGTGETYDHLKKFDLDEYIKGILEN